MVDTHYCTFKASNLTTERRFKHFRLFTALYPQRNNTIISSLNTEEILHMYSTWYIYILNILLYGQSCTSTSIRLVSIPDHKWQVIVFGEARLPINKYTVSTKYIENKFSIKIKSIVEITNAFISFVSSLCLYC